MPKGSCGKSALEDIASSADSGSVYHVDSLDIKLISGVVSGRDRDDVPADSHNGVSMIREVVETRKRASCGV